MHIVVPAGPHNHQHTYIYQALLRRWAYKANVTTVTLGPTTPNTIPTARARNKGSTDCRMLSTKHVFTTHMPGASRQHCSHCFIQPCERTEHGCGHASTFRCPVETRVKSPGLQGEARRYAPPDTHREPLCSLICPSLIHTLVKRNHSQVAYPQYHCKASLPWH